MAFLCAECADKKSVTLLAQIRSNEHLQLRSLNSEAQTPAESVVA